MSQAVRYERRGSLGMITVDNPPVNALSLAVRQGWWMRWHRARATARR